MLLALLTVFNNANNGTRPFVRKRSLGTSDRNLTTAKRRELRHFFEATTIRPRGRLDLDLLGFMRR